MKAVEPLPDVLKAQIDTGLQELDDLARAEYELSLQELLSNGEQLRVQRLVGIALKRKFARPIDRTAPGGVTGARRAWPWPDNNESMVPLVDDAASELEVLDELRRPGIWNERKRFSADPNDGQAITWADFKFDVDQERGLFKVVALYCVDKARLKDGRTIKEYMDAPESKSFKASLDLATLLFDFAVTPSLAGLLGVPTVAVGVALVGVQFGYDALVDPKDKARVGDQNS